MSEAVKSIVEIYVQHRNRAALEKIRAHREKLKADLQQKDNQLFDIGGLMREIDNDIGAIDQGLARLE